MKEKETKIAMKKIEIERHDDDGHVFWEAWLLPGWCWGEKGLHVFHADTKAEIKASAWMIEPCDCPECKAHIK
jgi:hypothetical protein